jgi:hypothetical protein
MTLALSAVNWQHGICSACTVNWRRPMRALSTVKREQDENDDIHHKFPTDDIDTLCAGRPVRLRF